MRTRTPTAASLLSIALCSASCGNPAAAPMGDARSVEVADAPSTAFLPGSYPPGTTGPSSSSGSHGMQMGVYGNAGTFTFIDRPVPGERSFDGQVLVSGAGLSTPPADTVVTLNGVALAKHPFGGGLLSFDVDPRGAQPTIGADGYLHLSATSASTGDARALDLACPFSPALSSTPAEGASLTGVAAVTLAWSEPLPLNAPVFLSQGIGVAQAALDAIDPSTLALSGRLATQLFTPSVQQVTLTRTAATAPGYLAELRFSGIYLLDGNSGGACGRTVRLVFAR